MSMRLGLVISRLRVLASRIRGFFSSRRLDDDFQQELDAHFSMLEEENLRRGIAPAEARRQARLTLGTNAPLREMHHDLRSLPWLESMLQDVRFGLRMLRKNPGFTAVAILTLALGIGANTAIFSVVDAVLLRSLPFWNADRLVAVSETHPAIPEIGASAADYRDWQMQSHSFQGLAVYDLTNFSHATLLAHGDPQNVRGAIISHNLFPLLGIIPAIGRNFLPQEDALGNGPVVILSNELWRTVFDANPNILGRSIEFNQKPYTVVGVLPAGLRFPQDADLWVPLGNLDKDDRTNRFYHPLFVIGRLRPGVAVAEARAELTGIAARLAIVYPQTNHDIGVKLEPLPEKYVGGLRRFLLVLWAAAGLVLLIACANVANLLLARASSREGEIALRSALGASRARIIRQTLTEGVILALLGGASGILLAWAGLVPLSQWLPKAVGAPILQLHQIRIDPAVLAVALIVSVLSGILFGLGPAVHAARGEASGALQSARHASPTARRRLAHRLAVSGEVALAVVVLVSAGLLVRSLQQLLATSPGFRVDHLLTMRVSLSGNHYKSPQAVAGFYQRLIPTLRALPGVQAVATIDETPFVPNLGVTRFLVDGAAAVRPGEYPNANYRQVSPGYFRTMDIPLLKGRTFRADDVPREKSTLIINHTLAERFFGSENPIGHKLLLGVAAGHLTAIRIVGVVGDTRDLSIDSPPPAEMYFAGFAQLSTLVVRSMVDPMSMAAAVRKAVLSVDPSQPVFAIQTGTQLVDGSIARQRASAILLGSFSVLALILAAVGIYGVTSYGVSERTREIGVRMTLGAQPRDVLRLILRQEMLAAAIGILVGLAGALVATRLLATLLYGVSATDATTYGGVCLVFAVTSALACYVPARRAMRVDPMVALRHE
jgi:putative ABC transport system permease protein